MGSIPARRPGFQPRPALLARLNRANWEAPVLVLTGTPGVGKTQLAAAYARARLEAGWRLVAWVDAHDRASLLAGLAAVADAVRLSDGGSWRGAADVGQAVRHWLQTDGHRCLLVFDDVEDPDVLRLFVPAGGPARVLVTAARESVAKLGPSIPVDAFSAGEALALLNGRTGLTDEAGAAAVAAELGYLPLGLDQAAAVIAGQDLGYTAYLAQLRALPVEQYRFGEEKRYPQGAAEAMLLSLVDARVADPVGVCAGVMEVMSVLSPAAVCRDLLHAAGQAGMLASDGRWVSAPVVDQALAQLEERSLLGFTIDGQAVIVHRLVACFVRDSLARRGRLALACRATASALRTSVEALEEPRNYAAVRGLLGQVRALLDNAKGPVDTDEELGRMLIRLRFLVLNHLIDLGDNLPQAIAFGEPLIADLEGILGSDHPDTLSARNSLATAYHAAGRVADAIPLIQQTLVAQERLLGADHPSTLASRNNLASAYRATGRVAEAVPLFERNVTACERLLGADHPKTLASRHNLDRALQESAQARIAGHSRQQQA